MTVPVEGKPAPLISAVGIVPKHEVSVDLVEAIAGIKESSAKASLRFILEEAGVLGCPGINPGGKHAISADTIPQGCVAGVTAILLLLSGTILGPFRRLRPNGPNGMEVGLDP